MWAVKVCAEGLVLLEGVVIRQRLIYQAPQTPPLLPGGRLLTLPPWGTVWCFPWADHDRIIAALPGIVERVPQPILQALQTPIDPPIPRRLPASLEATLYPYQRAGVDWVIARGGRGLLADAMGLGKTLQGLALLAHYSHIRPAVIVCPPSVRASWVHHIREHLHEEPIVLKNSKTPWGSGIHVVSYGLLTRLPPFTPRFLLVDEAHYARHITSQRTRALLKWSGSAPHVVLLSGTPLNRPLELYAQLRMVAPRLFPHFFHFNPKRPAHGVLLKDQPEPERLWFAARYCAPQWKKGRCGRMEFDFRRSDNEAELHAVLTHQVLLRRTKEEVLQELPPKTREHVHLDDVKEAQGATLTPDFHRDSDFLAAVRSTAELKRPLVQAYVAEVLRPWLAADPGLKVLLWGHHHAMLDMLAEGWGDDECVCIDGRTPTAARGALIEKFQTQPQVRVAILGILAVGAGVTLTAATLALFCELALTPSELEQAEDRLHRVGQHSPVTVRYLILPHSTDEVIWRLLGAKKRTSTYILEGRSDATWKARRTEAAAATAAAPTPHWDTLLNDL